MSFKRAAVDVRYFIKTFCYTARKMNEGTTLLDETTVPSLFPAHAYFEPWYCAFEERANVVWIKTRQMGASWVVMLSYLHALTFKTDWCAIIVSRQGGYVDNGGKLSTYKSLFGKVRYAWSLLPEELQGDLRFVPLQMYNNLTGSFLDGETANPDAGRSGSYDAGLADEAARLHWGEEVYSALHNACPRALTLLSTPNGRSNMFARVAHIDTKELSMIRTFWWQHPERRCQCVPALNLDPSVHQGCWYARESETMTEAQRGAELNGSFETSTAGRVFPAFDATTHMRDVPYLPTLHVIRSWDFGVGGQCVILFWQKYSVTSINGNTLVCARLFDCYANSEKPVSHYADVLHDKAQSYGRGQVLDVGDPFDIGRHAEKYELSNWYSNLRTARRDYPIHVSPCDCRDAPYETVLDNARKMLTVVSVLDDSGAIVKVPRTIIDKSLRSVEQALENWAYPTDQEGRIIGDGKPATDAANKFWSHWCDSFKYGEWYISPHGAEDARVPTLMDARRGLDAKGLAFEGAGEIFGAGGWEG